MVVSDPGRAAEILRRGGLTVDEQPGQPLQVGSNERSLDLAVITRLLAEQDLYVAELTPIRRDLETVFLELTAEEHLGAADGTGAVDGADGAGR